MGRPHRGPSRGLMRAVAAVVAMFLLTSFWIRAQVAELSPKERHVEPMALSPQACDLQALAVPGDATMADRGMAFVSATMAQVVTLKYVQPNTSYTEGMILTALRLAVGASAAQHIVQPLAFGTCTWAQVSKLIPSSVFPACQRQGYPDICQHQLMHPQAAVGVLKTMLVPLPLSEAMARLALLPDAEQSAAWRAVVFQLVFTVAALQRAFPGFRHNDLGINLRAAEASGLEELQYILPQGGARFSMPSRPPIFIKLIDFELAWALNLPNARRLSLLQRFVC